MQLSLNVPFRWALDLIVSTLSGRDVGHNAIGHRRVRSSNHCPCIFILTTVARLLSGAVVNVHVGNKRKCFVVHATLLQESCPYFKSQICSSKQDQNATEELYLPSDDAEVFQLFHTWLYTQKLKPISKRCKEKGGNFEDDHFASTDLYFHLYYMTEARGLSKLQNLTMDRLRQYYATEDRVAGWERCDQVYQRTSPESPMRDFMVRQFLHVYMDKKQSSEAAKKMLQSRLQMKQGRAFMVDMLGKMRHQAGRKAWSSPNDGGGCLFHVHEAGVVCQDLDS